MRSKKGTGKRRRVSASFTVEMSVLMPMILFLIMGCILAAFYYHDKSILSGAAYETAVVGSTKMREKNGIKEEELEALLKERIRGKCILMTEVKTSVDISKKEIRIGASVSHGKMRIEVVKAAAVTEPEKQIRKKGEWEDRNGAKNYHRGRRALSGGLSNSDVEDQSSGRIVGDWRARNEWKKLL